MVLAHPLYVYHVDFDHVLQMILRRDRSAVIVFAVHTPQPSSSSSKTCPKTKRGSQKLQPPIDLQSQLLSRLFADKVDDSLKQRVVFYYPRSMEKLIRVIAAAHLMLDPFPISNLFAPYLALSLGVPVITMPSLDQLAGRYTQELYKMMGMSGSQLIVGSSEDYINIALMLVHKPGQREEISAEILRRKKVFYDNQSLEKRLLRDQWLSFLQRIQQYRGN
jgi:hypothetical protein